MYSIINVVYCEKEILSGYTVEHFRPCGGYQEVKGGNCYETWILLVGI